MFEIFAANRADLNQLGRASVVLMMLLDFGGHLQVSSLSVRQLAAENRSKHLAPSDPVAKLNIDLPDDAARDWEDWNFLVCVGLNSSGCSNAGGACSRHAKLLSHRLDFDLSILELVE